MSFFEMNEKFKEAFRILDEMMDENEKDDPALKEAFRERRESLKRRVREQDERTEKLLLQELEYLGKL